MNTRLALLVCAVVTLIAVYAWLRAPGIIAVGSDNDEYQLVAKALLRLDAPVVAGVEGTKYPLLYPAILALMLLARIPLYIGTAVVNVAALAVAVTSVAWLVGRSCRGIPVSIAAGFGAAALLLTSRAVWNDMFSTMPELLLLGVLALMLVAVDRPDTVKRTVTLTVLAVAAVSLKTLALPLILGGFGIMWLYDRRAQLLIAPAAATIVTFASMLWMRRYPSHTTGYVETFLLNDPDDAALGSISPTGVVTRTVRQIPDALRDIGHAFVSLSTTRIVAISIAMILLGLGVWGARKLGRTPILGRFTLGAVIAYTVAMALWPYNAARFGVPLLPIAALGVGWLLRLLGASLQRRSLDVVAAAAVTIGLIAMSATAVRDDGAAARQLLPVQHTALDAVATWIETNAPDAQLVSFDYREIANRTDGTVKPIGYTSDPAELRAQLGDADLLVVMRFYGKRTRQAEILLDTHPELFVKEFSVDRGVVYSILR